MSIEKRNYFSITLSFFTILILGSTYFFYFRDWVRLAFEGKAPAVLQLILDWFYPRFEVERQRFDLGFFLNKADQIFYRLIFVVTVLITLVYGNTNIIKKISEEKSVAFTQLKFLKYLFYFGLFVYSYDWIYDLLRLAALGDFYKPVFLLKLLGIPLFSSEFFIALFSIYLISLFCILCHFRPVWSASINAVLFLLINGFFLSFEKIDHGYVPLIYISLIMPFLVYEIRKNSKSQQMIVSSWTVPLIQFIITQLYFLAGLEKLFTAGINWVKPVTFSTYLKLHETPVGLAIAENDFLCTLLPICAMVFQLSFVFILFLPKYKYYFLTGGLFFHWGTVILFNVGSFYSPWIFSYIFFIDWPVLGDKILAGLRLKSNLKIFGETGVKVK